MRNRAWYMAIAILFLAGLGTTFYCGCGGGGGGSSGSSTPTVTIPTAPTNFSVTGYFNSITSKWDYVYTWQDNSNNEQGFIVEGRLIPAITWTELESCPANTTATTGSEDTQITGVAARIRAYNSAGSSYSNEVIFP